MKKYQASLYIVTSVTVLTLICSSASKAQNINEIVNPALIEKKLDEGINLPHSNAPSVALPGLTIVPPKGGETIQFPLKKIEFIGGSIFNHSKLQELSAPYINRQIKLSDLYTLAENVTRLYRNKGYLLSRAVIPPQEIGHNRVAKIQLIEGYVDSISYEGDTSKISARAKAYAEKIKESRPLNSRDLERYLLLMKDLPGLEVEAVLKPSTTHPNASTLVIIAKRKVAEATVGINNFGSRYIGPYMLNGMTALNSPLGFDEQFIFHGAVTQRTRQLRHGRLIYNQFVGTEGTKLSLSGSVTETRPGDSLRVLDISGYNKSLTLGVQHPFLRSRSQSFSLGADFTVRNVKSGLLNNAVQSKDKLRIMSIKATWDVADSFKGVNLVNLELSRGLSGFGATKNSYLNKSRISGISDFTKLNLDVSRVQGLWGNFSLFGIVEGQQAFDPLLSSERFSYGGSAYFRTYTDAPITGDSGIKEKVELRYGEVLSSGKISDHFFLSSYQAYGFYGLGTAWNKKPSFDERKRTSAPEVGGGIRLTLFKNTYANLEYTRPLKKKIGTFKNPSTLFFSLTQKF